ncbi:tyrosine-protein kinase yes-like [Convolutriloba macropyga]|uniref:tyrosine-protein kinase yes-like n=1 Tax=Convolutriloba macropyga TaxID=536237 RepID=UPI003F520278
MGAICCSDRSVPSPSSNEKTERRPSRPGHTDPNVYKPTPVEPIIETPPPQQQHAPTELRAIFTFTAENNELESNEVDLVKGRIYQLIDSNVDEWFRVQDPITFRRGFAPAKFLQPAHLKVEPDWFFGEIDRTKAIEILQLQMHKKGNFIVRASSKQGCFALSLRCLDDDPYDRQAIKHYAINITEEGEYFLNEKNKFKSMEEFLNYYSGHTGGMEVPLTSPCSKEKPPVPNRIKRDMAGLSQLPKERIRFEGEKPLGSGFFGEVWKARIDSRSVAVKTLTNQSAESRQSFLKEAENMNKYRHENLVDFVCVSYDERSNKIYLVSEFMGGGDLHAFLSKRRKRNERFHNDYLLKIGMQVLEGMVYLESQSAVHRDLRAQNVLVGDNDDVFKISDFGLLRDDNTKDVHTKFPIRWTAPEAIKDSTRFSTKSDVWSFGILMIEVMSMGINPYPEIKSIRDVQRFVMAGSYHPKPDDCPQAIYDIITLCWMMDPNRRPTFSGLRNTWEESLLDTGGQYNQ